MNLERLIGCIEDSYEFQGHPPEVAREEAIDCLIELVWRGMKFGYKISRDGGYLEDADPMEVEALLELDHA